MHRALDVHALAEIDRVPAPGLGRRHARLGELGEGGEGRLVVAEEVLAMAHHPAAERPRAAQGAARRRQA